MELCPALRRLVKAVHSIYQFVCQWVMVSFRGHRCLLWQCLYLSLWIEVFYKAHSLMCHSTPQLVIWMLWTGSLTVSRTGLLCSWSATFTALIFCLMTAVTCTRGIHQHSGVREVSYSLLLTVNNDLMCKADFCSCVVPQPDCRFPYGGCTVAHERQFCNALIDSYLQRGQIKWKYCSSWR